MCQLQRRARGAAAASVTPSPALASTPALRVCVLPVIATLTLSFFCSSLPSCSAPCLPPPPAKGTSRIPLSASPAPPPRWRSIFCPCPESFRESLSNSGWSAFEYCAHRIWQSCCKSFWATHEGGQQTARDGQRLERSQRQQPTTRRAHASATVFCGGESQDNRERSHSTLQFAAAGACGAETAAAATHGSRRVTYAARFCCRFVNNFRFIAGIVARVFASLLGAFHLRCFDGE